MSDPADRSVVHPFFPSKAVLFRKVSDRILLVAGDAMEQQKSNGSAGKLKPTAA